MNSYIIAFLFVLFNYTVQEPPVYVCDSTNVEFGKENIYCKGRILEAVNKWRLYPDSKDYVDSTLVKSPDETYKEFNSAFPSDSDITKDKLQKFVTDHFQPPESELDHCTPTDWKSNPPRFNVIQDPNYKQFALHLNDIWKELCRTMNKFVQVNRTQHSLLYVPHPFIAPGGRFREFYYWDSYWIVKGLLASSMHDSVMNMIVNLASMVDKYGFVPNGGRIYFLKRSQPPLLIPMVYEYFLATNNIAFVRNILPTLAKEIDFWRQNRQINLTDSKNVVHTMYQYRSHVNTPRPESWKEDYATFGNKTVSDGYKHIQAACESGWDFSSRWFKDKKSMNTIHTNDIVPIDLNAIICWNLEILEYLYRTVGDTTSAQRVFDERLLLRDGLLKMMYNKTEKAWFDYDITIPGHNVDFYPSIAVPLFTGCYRYVDQFKPEHIYAYLKKSGAFQYPGGIPTSLHNTSQQWDFPNGWPPLVHMIIEGFRKSDDAGMQQDAFVMADKWVQNNYITYNTFQKSGCPCMFEKLNVIEKGIGKGGEYEVQKGFGWSNGVVLDLMLSYGDRLKAPPIPTPSSSTTTLASYIITFLHLSVILIFALNL